MRVITLLFASVFLMPSAYAENAPEEAGVRVADGVSVSGYVRARYGAVLEDDEAPSFVGLNDGFQLDNARLVVSARKGSMDGVISIDGAVDRRAANNTADGQVDVGLKDAWVRYNAFSALRVSVGQFKPPVDAEELESTQDMFFIQRSVASRGVRGVEGYNIEGIAFPRQVGLLLDGALAVGAGVTLGYGASASNGSGANRPINDNDKLAYSGRFTISHREHLTVGAGVHWNERTIGSTPDLLSERQLAWAADLRYSRHLGPIRILVTAQYQSLETESLDVANEPSIVGHGYHGALGSGLPAGISIGYRYAMLDPTADFEAEDPNIRAVFRADEVVHHTIGLGYDVSSLPVLLKANYTVAQEDAARAISNDRLDILVQASF